MQPNNTINHFPCFILKLVLLKKIRTVKIHRQNEAGWSKPFLPAQAQHPKQGQPPEVTGLPLPHLSLSATFTEATEEAD